MYNKMVNSNVNPLVEYKETTDIDPDDLKYESFPYNIIFDTIGSYLFNHAVLLLRTS